jgi:hypothetical protein
MKNSLLLFCTLLLQTVACGRQSDTTPVARGSAARDTSVRKMDSAAPRSYGVGFNRSHDSIVSYDTVTLEKLLLEHAKTDVTVWRWAVENLDDDPQMEMLLVASFQHEPTGIDSIDRAASFREHFVVVDSSTTGATIVLDEAVSNTVAEGSPELGVFSRSVKSPAFYVREYSTRGSGAVLQYNRIFRLWKGSVRESNEILAESGLWLCGSEINQEASSMITQPTGDRLLVQLRYSFNSNECTPERILDSLCLKSLAREDETDNVPLVTGSATVIYHWNPDSAGYIPDYRGTGLSPAKMECLMTLGPDDIFVAAFREELEHLARGTRCKRILARYLLDNL